MNRIVTTVAETTITNEYQSLTSMTTIDLSINDVFNSKLKELGGKEGIRQKLVDSINGALRYLGFRKTDLDAMCGFGVERKKPRSQPGKVAKTQVLDRFPSWETVSNDPALLTSRIYGIASSALSVKLNDALSEVELSPDETEAIAKNFPGGAVAGCGDGDVSEVKPEQQAHLYLLLRLLKVIDS